MDVVVGSFGDRLVASSLPACSWVPAFAGMTIGPDGGWGRDDG